MLGDYENFIDMINGGGAGRAGQRFEGGGLLSMLANEFARPYGYQDRLSEARPRMRPAGLAASPTGPSVAPPAVSPMTPMMRGEDTLMSMPVAALRPSNVGMTGLGGTSAPAPMMAPPAPQPMQYGGPAGAGASRPVTPEEQQILDYLRSVGALNY